MGVLSNFGIMQKNGNHYNGVRYTFMHANHMIATATDR